MKNLEKRILIFGALITFTLGCEPTKDPSQGKKEITESPTHYTETKTQEPKIIPVPRETQETKVSETKSYVKDISEVIDKQDEAFKRGDKNNYLSCFTHSYVRNNLSSQRWENMWNDPNILEEMIRQAKEIKIIRKELVKKSDYSAVYKVCSEWDAPSGKRFEYTNYYLIKENGEWKINNKE